MLGQKTTLASVYTCSVVTIRDGSEQARGDDDDDKRGHATLHLRRGRRDRNPRPMMSVADCNQQRLIASAAGSYATERQRTQAGLATRWTTARRYGNYSLARSRTFRFFGVGVSS